MNEVYIGYEFKVQPTQSGTEILIAELGYAGFESFVETEWGVKAYLKKEDWHPQILESVQILKNKEFRISYFREEIEQINWNAAWEKNFEPILVDGLCTVRAPFHPEPNTDFDIVIEPKMSFGTGHHETTHMMIKLLLGENLEKKAVLDMGCGTGILAILASMKGAIQVDAIDIDSWCYENAMENTKRNKCHHIRVKQGDASLLEGVKYDVIIANINRNVLLEDIQVYAQCMAENGVLFLSGFYMEDIQLIDSKCREAGLRFHEKIEKNNWVAVKYVN